MGLGTILECKSGGCLALTLNMRSLQKWSHSLRGIKNKQIIEKKKWINNINFFLNYKLVT